MIRLSVNNDREGIISLWQEAFGDSKDEINVFLKNKYFPDDTLIYEIDGEIASMLFLLDGDMCIEGKDYPSYYLYAACTAKKHRGKGLMAALLEFAKEISGARNKYFICLMPAEKSLFNFYERFGYKSLFKYKLLTVDREEIESDCDFSISDEENIIVNFFEIRKRAFEKFDYFKWDSKAINFAFEHNKLYSGGCLRNRKGYLLYSQSTNGIIVKENTFAEPEFKAALKKLFDFSVTPKITIRLPVCYDVAIGKSEIVDCAMLTALNKNAEKLMNKMKNPYLGLTLD